MFKKKSRERKLELEREEMERRTREELHRLSPEPEPEQEPPAASFGTAVVPLGTTYSAPVARLRAEPPTYPEPESDAELLFDRPVVWGEPSEAVPPKRAASASPTQEESLATAMRLMQSNVALTLVRPESSDDWNQTMSPNSAEARRAHALKELQQSASPIAQLGRVPASLDLYGTSMPHLPLDLGPPPTGRDLAQLPTSPQAVAELVQAQTKLVGRKSLKYLRGDRISRSESFLEVSEIRRISFAYEHEVKEMVVTQDELESKRAFNKLSKTARKTNRAVVRHEEWLVRIDAVAKAEAERLRSSSGSEASEPEPEDVLPGEKARKARAGGSQKKEASQAANVKLGELVHKQTSWDSDDTSTSTDSDHDESSSPASERDEHPDSEEEELQQVAERVISLRVAEQQRETEKAEASTIAVEGAVETGTVTGIRVPAAGVKTSTPRSILKPEQPAAIWQRSTMWAGGIPEEIASEAFVAEVFGAFGEVASVTIRLKPTAQHGPCKSWAFVTFVKPHAAARARLASQLEMDESTLRRLFAKTAGGIGGGDSSWITEGHTCVLVLKETSIPQVQKELQKPATGALAGIWAEQEKKLTSVTEETDGHLSPPPQARPNGTNDDEESSESSSEDSDEEDDADDDDDIGFSALTSRAAGGGGGGGKQRLSPSSAKAAAVLAAQAVFAAARAGVPPDGATVRIESDEEGSSDDEGDDAAEGNAAGYASKTSESSSGEDAAGYASKTSESSSGEEV